MDAGRIAGWALALAGMSLGVSLGPGAALAAPVPPSVNLHALLTGAAVAPGPGAASGSGEFGAVLVQKGTRLCYDLTLEGGLVATTAAIHVGKPGTADVMVMALTPPGAAGTVTTCLKAPERLARHLAFFPDDYYVQVGTANLPEGALRGQLWKDGMEPAGQSPLPLSPRIAQAQASAAAR